MTLAEFKKEFQTHYDMSSAGAPEMNDYEISLFLTQAVRDIVGEIYQNFEHTEYVKQGLGPLISERALELRKSTDYFDKINVFEAVLPSNMFYILQENVMLNNKAGRVEVMSEDLDNINISIKNPFRKPNSRRVYRTQIGDKRVRIYSDQADNVTAYKIKFIKKYKPIILSNFAMDPDLMGDETIDGLQTPSTTELPDFLHDKIVRRAVVLAIKSFRNNNLQTQIEV